MSKQELLEECISLAYKINKFGSHVYLEVSPHDESTTFRYYENGNYRTGTDLHLSIYEDQNYEGYEHKWKDNQPINVEDLHVFLTNLLKSKENVKELDVVLTHLLKSLENENEE